MLNPKDISEYSEDDSIDFSNNMEMLQNIVYKVADKMPFVQTELDLRFGVRSPIIKNPKNEPGDIDICAVISGDIAFAFQAKKFKFKAINEENDRATRGITDKLSKVMSQANNTLPFGFNKTGILLILNYDGSKRSTSGPVFGGMNNGNL